MIDWVSNIIEAIGYPGLVFIMALENVFPPIPSEIVLPLAGYQVFIGSMNIVLAIVAATLGSVIGGSILFFIARRGGRPLLLKYRRILRISERDIDRADGWFECYGSWLVFLGRMIPLIRSIVSVPAGTLEMTWRRFLILTTAGSAIWNTALISGGFALGNNWTRVGDWIHTASPYLIAAAVIALAWAIVPKVRNRRHAASS